jgi:hypothetical protein
MATQMRRIPPEVVRAGSSTRPRCEAMARRTASGFLTARVLAKIEVATLRLVALRVSRNRSNTAARLGMAPLMNRWLGRCETPVMLSRGGVHR